jgi:hypothetical protein
MKGLKNNHSHSAVSSHRSKFMILIVLSVCMLFAFVLSAGSANLLSSVSAASIARASTTSTEAGYPVKVYFSRVPDSLNNPSAVFPVNRISPTIAVATFSIQLLIAGPTLSERSAGYFSEFNSILTGPSSCSAPYPTGGPDFKITLNMKGSAPSPGTATLRFCRASSSPGIGADARILAEINATLKQFSNINNVVVLTQAGHCFGDLSGKDFCLK